MNEFFFLKLGLTHGALYVLLSVTPLTAIFGAWAQGHDLTPLYLPNIPPLIAQSKSLGPNLADIHGVLGDAIMWIAGLHAAAALYHHFWLRDAVLAAMLPWARR